MQTGRHLTLHIDRPTDNFEQEIGYVRERERSREREREWRDGERERPRRIYILLDMNIVITP